MVKILIEDIEKEPNKTLYYEFNEFMEEFGADISADLELKSLGQFIEVKGSAQGKLKLICDRCLNEFDYDLDIEIEETFAKHALQDEYSQEFELQRGQFIIDLNDSLFSRNDLFIKSLRNIKEWHSIPSKSKFFLRYL